MVKKGRSPEEEPRPSEEREALAVGPEAPGPVGEVAAEGSSCLFGSWIPTVEQPVGGEIVGLSSYRKLLVGSEGRLRLVLF